MNRMIPGGEGGSCVGMAVSVSSGVSTDKVFSVMGRVGTEVSVGRIVSVGRGAGGSLGTSASGGLLHPARKININTSALILRFVI